MEIDLPRVLIASTTSSKAGDIARSIGSIRLSDQCETENYVWNIDNKYYKAQVLVCAIDSPWMEISSKGIEALIVHHDARAEHAMQRLNEWIPLILSLSEVEVLLLACNSISDGPIKDQVAEWCKLHKFELVELECLDPKVLLDFKDENSKYGIDRIVEALHAHAWPNMELKNSSPDNDPSSMEKACLDVNRIEEQLENVRLGTVCNNPNNLQMEGVLDGIMGGENTDFGELFGQLLAMKEHAASLPTNQRRVAAEHLVTAFWKAMCGDPEEVDELE